jgi:hypothetical protein
VVSESACAHHRGMTKPVLVVEEVLRELESKAAMLRYLNDSAALNPELPDAAALSGIADVCGEIQRWARSTRGSLSVEALGTAVRPKHRE